MAGVNESCPAHGALRWQLEILRAKPDVVEKHGIGFSRAAGTLATCTVADRLPMAFDESVQSVIVLEILQHALQRKNRSGGHIGGMDRRMD